MPGLTETEYAQFSRSIATLSPIRLEYYKQQQMERRIRDLARKHQAPDLQAFATMLRADRKLLKEFEEHVTINVSEFYRNPEAFVYLASQVLPQLGVRQRGLRIWSAGCSNGAEPYTFAMLLQELAPSLRHTIYASDIDHAVLARARSGQGYTADDVRGLPRQYRERYLVWDGAAYRVADTIQRQVRFAHQDLLRDPVTQQFDLIACRNVVIYFTDPAKATLYQKFADALRPGGYLFVGATETINRAAGFGLRYVAPCFYVKDGS